jgi:multicomponent Na+:H+ antiporter subunit D
MNPLLIFVALPLFTAFLLPLFSKLFKRGYEIVALLVSGVCLFSALALFIHPPAMPFVYAIGGWKPPFGISWLFDSLTALMLIVVNLITFFACLYSINYLKQFTCAWQYYTLFMLMLTGLNGVVISGDLFNVFVFLEITAISSYALVAYGTEAEEMEAAFKYMVLGSVASTFILMAIAFLYAKTATLNMFDLASVLSSTPAEKFKIFVIALFIVGFGLKAALVPFHAWLADAHPSAPAPISAMLSGVVIKVIGVYALARILFNLCGISLLSQEILLVLGGLSMLIGVLLAIGQWDFKRLLAYHSISQIGYVVCGLGLATPLGIAGGLFHLFNHSVFKSLLFLNAGSVEYATHTRELKKLGNLNEEMPITSATSLVASLSIAGVPPFCGFWSKLMIIIALFEAGRYIYAAVAILVGVITLASFLKIQKYVFYRKNEERKQVAKEVPLAMVLSMVGLAILCLLIGLFFRPLYTHLLLPAAEVLTKGPGYFAEILGKF